MGNSASTPPTPAATSAAPQKPDVSGCPVHHAKGAAPPHPTPASSQPASEPAGESGCPVAPDTRKRYKNPKVFNVYSQEIQPSNPLNPDNNMPSKPAQQQTEGQRIALDTNRVKSNIPKGGTDSSTWEYPSPQMFWNAIVRKGKQGDTDEEDMDVVVAIHNNMNENTWSQVVAWEGLHPAPADMEGAEPKLLRFTGRPDENSPKSKIKQWIFGCPSPFDRHDWIVDRGGKEVRYIIDYYHNDEGVKSDEVPGLKDVDKIKSIKIDVRPALDSVESVVDRLFRMPLAVFQGNTPFSYLPLTSPKGSAGPTPTPIMAKREPKELPKELAEIGDKLSTKCERSLQRVAACKDDTDCRNAQIALTFCYASVVCPSEAKAFDTAMHDEGSSEHALESAFHSMRTCVEGWQTKTMQSIDPKK